MAMDHAGKRLRIRGTRTWVVAVVVGGLTLLVFVLYIVAMIYNREWPSEGWVKFRRYRPRVTERATIARIDFKDAGYFCSWSRTSRNLGWFCEADLVAAGEYLNAIGDAQVAALSLVPVIMLLYAALVCLIAPIGFTTRPRLVLATVVVFLLGAFISVTVFVTTSRLHTFNAEGHGDTIPPPANWNWESKPALMYGFGGLFTAHWLAMVVMGVMACASALIPDDHEGDDEVVDTSGPGRVQQAQQAAAVPATADGVVVMGVPATVGFSPKLADLVGGKDDVRAFLQRERVRTFADLEDCLTWGVLPGSREGAWLWKTRDPAAVVPEAEGGASLIAFIRHLVDQRSRRSEFEKLSDISPG